ncbi:MAG TPA: FAD-dependent oxidoreductase, partial [Methylomirabilota bacterium]|nr:FAD-dependent oxidoreductase [Methylomirabilota bacterium]
MSETLPRTADIVVIGAGAVGASIAYHLARRGARDVVVLERDQVGAGSTSKAAGGIRVQFGTRVEVEFSLRGIEFFKRFEDEMGVPCDFHQEGYLFVVTDEPTLDRFRTNVALQRSLGADVRVIAPDDARALVPALNVDDAIAAVWGPTDGYASPNDVVQAYAARARALGARIVEGTPVTGIRIEGRR